MYQIDYKCQGEEEGGRDREDRGSKIESACEQHTSYFKRELHTFLERFDTCSMLGYHKPSDKLRW